MLPGGIDPSVLVVLGIVGAPLLIGFFCQTSAQAMGYSAGIMFVAGIVGHAIVFQKFYMPTMALILAAGVGALGYGLKRLLKRMRRKKDVVPVPET